MLSGRLCNIWAHECLIKYIYKMRNLLIVSIEIYETFECVAIIIIIIINVLRSWLSLFLYLFKFKQSFICTNGILFRLLLK